MQQRTRAYNVWSDEEKQALQSGVLKHGLGAWEVIRKDPEFACLEKRTGVQLKDKFRNLVKFRHLSEDESRQLKPKANGPWSRKYTNAGGGQQFDRSQTRSPSRLASPNPTPEKEHAEALLALENRARSEETQSENEGQDGKLHRKRRRSLENRNFGIYDRRRYNADGTQWKEGDGLQGTYTQEELRGRGGRGRGRGARRGSARSRSRYDVYDDDSEETEEDEEELEALRSGERRCSQRAGRGRQQAGAQSQAGSSIVACPCGAQVDDGAEMIECEECKCWAHTGCLRQLMAQQPLVYNFNLDSYRCLNCQHRATAHLLGGGSSGAGSLALPPLPSLALSPFGLPHPLQGGMLSGMMPHGPSFPGCGLAPFLDGMPLQQQSQQGGSSGALAALLGASMGSGGSGGEEGAAVQVAWAQQQQQELLRSGLGGFGPPPGAPQQLLQPQRPPLPPGQAQGSEAMDMEAMAAAAVGMAASMGLSAKPMGAGGGGCKRGGACTATGPIRQGRERGDQGARPGRRGRPHGAAPQQQHAPTAGRGRQAWGAGGLGGCAAGPAGPAGQHGGHAAQQQQQHGSGHRQPSRRR